MMQMNYWGKLLKLRRIKMSKKGRFYIQIKEIFDNGFALGSMQDYVDIMNNLDKQNENKGKQISELQQQLAGKDKEIAELKQTINTIQQNTISASVDDVNLIHELENQLAEKDQQIAELEEQLENAIVPKFNRQEHIYCVAFGEIREFVVVAYLDSNITLCEDTTTSKLEWCNNEFLVLTKEEALSKLEELKGE